MINADRPIPCVQLEQVKISYGDNCIVRDCDLVLQEGEVLALLGPSGCGKSTLLNAVAGLTPVQAGKIYLYGELASSPDYNMPPQVRHVGMIFQDYALFPHLTVEGNIRFGLRGMNKHEARDRVEAMLKLVKLEGMNKRYPHELSGGQQQRVAIARAMACQPRLLLLDEPFSNLDHAVATELLSELRQLFTELHMSAIFVTHNQSEAYALADRVALMEQGRIAQERLSQNQTTCPCCGQAKPHD